MSQSRRVQGMLKDALRHYEAGRFEQAKQICDRALTLNAADPLALQLGGMATHQLGDHTGSVALLQRAANIEKNDASIWNNLGNALRTCARTQEAMAAFQKAMQLDPKLAEAHSNFGFGLYEQGQLEESLEHFQRAIAVDPNFMLARNNLGCALEDLQRTDEAIAVYQEALRRNPQCADTYANLGNALRRRDRHDEALEILRRGLELSPHLPEALINLGGVYRDLWRFDEARDCYERAIAARPNYAEAHWNLALVLLLQGDFARGWREYTWCRHVKKVAPKIFPRNSQVWQGEPLAGKTILLVADQGLGDTIQFIRYAPLLKQQGATVVAAVQPALRELLKNCPGVDALVPLADSFPPHDYYSLLLSLPAFLTPHIASIPQGVPYIQADARLIEKWRPRMEAIAGFKIGIAWQGNPEYELDRYRSVPLRQFEQLAKIPGVQLVSLQRGFGTQQLAEVRRDFSVVELGEELDLTTGAFMETAAVMYHLDLVICIDSALTHVAGALGAPIWLLASTAIDWRWLLDRDDSPWYPTLYLYRQKTRLQWQSVFDRMEADLRHIVAAKK